MTRSLRLSAVAAARKIQLHAQVESDDDVEAPVSKVRAQSFAAAAAREKSSNKRKRAEESPEYEAEAVLIEESGDDEEETGDGDSDADVSGIANMSTRRGQAATGKMKAAKTQPTEVTATLTGPPLAKRRKPPKKSTTKCSAPKHILFGLGADEHNLDDRVLPACCPPERTHTIEYHRPLLLDGKSGRKARNALLAWYDSVRTTRGMPWRRDTWLHPEAGLAEDATEETRNQLARRAYEVWMSEVMAQQTRIPVVIAYWTRWMKRWPTLPDLAGAAAHEVFQEWSGLGYYSRATRVHEAAKLVAADPVFRGMLPPDAATLEARVPGVGRYTAGAISAIVFGRPTAMVDGNVIRVLSRQLGLFADSKADKDLLDLLWAAAEALVQVVAQDENEEDDEKKRSCEAPVSDRPGRWGQALMELGSTVCMPKPDCAACPISSTCRVFAEGLLLHERGKKVVSFHGSDETRKMCDLCEQFPELDEEDAATLAKVDQRSKSKQVREKREKNKMLDQETSSLENSPYFDMEDVAAGLTLSGKALATIIGHARSFPLRRPKKPVREVETLVCAVRVVKGRKGDGDLYLLHQRPKTGLLASLWQLPSYDLPSALGTTAARRREAEAFVARWLTDAGDGKQKGPPVASLKTLGNKQLGSIPWLFSHVRQTMHVYLFDMAMDDNACSMVSLPTPASCCWVSVSEADTTYTMGTGMRKCWHLVKDALVS
ncbi:hypothetical protein SEPCBS57363_001411 [Sporothrix epigloea]|uniref:Adenine DNA glycosylase n=1 Tax=Sporothrix epigloea TaxID=1892477 RepID=A0ABP0DBS0_9PEZI